MDYLIREPIKAVVIRKIARVERMTNQIVNGQMTDNELEDLIDLLRDTKDDLKVLLEVNFEYISRS